MDRPNPADRPRLGLLAGWGRYPVVLADALRQRGFQVCCFAVRDHADPVLRDLCDAWAEGPITQFGQAADFFAREGVRDAVMAGKVHKVRLFDSWAFWKNLPDWSTTLAFYQHFITGAKDRRDDTLLLAVVNYFAERGVTFHPATDLAPELLIAAGQLSTRALTPHERGDAEVGWETAREMGRRDIGQAVAVRGRSIIAVEAIEGTDECIRRAGQLCRQGGFTVVKVAKPRQDMRFDVPTIGVGTIESLIAAGGSALVVEAGQTIFVDRPRVLELANRHGLALAALTDASWAAQRKAA